MGTAPDPTSQKSWLDRLGQVFLGEPKNREELVEILHDAQERNLFDTGALAMIEGVLQVSELQVHDIMIHVNKIEKIDGNKTLREAMFHGLPKQYSRLPVEHDGQIVGETTSGAWGYRINASVALGMVRPDLAVPGTELEVEIYGEKCRAVVQEDQPLWDAENERLRA